MSSDVYKNMYVKVHSWREEDVPAQWGLNNPPGPSNPSEFDTVYPFTEFKVHVSKLCDAALGKDVAPCWNTVVNAAPPSVQQGDVTIKCGVAQKWTGPGQSAPSNDWPVKSSYM